MCTGKSDISANRAPKECQDSRNQCAELRIRNKAVLYRCRNRRLYNENDYKDNHNHDTAQNLYELIHNPLSIFGEENEYCESPCNKVGNLHRNSQGSLNPESTSTYISDIKHQTAKNNQEGDKVSKSRK